MQYRARGGFPAAWSLPQRLKPGSFMAPSVEAKASTYLTKTKPASREQDHKFHQVARMILELMQKLNPAVRIGTAVVVVLAVIAYLAVTGVQANKSYYVTIGELQGMGDSAYVKHLRVAGNVQPGSIHRVGSNADFVLVEQGRILNVSYQGVEPPPDTFKDSA